MRPEQILKSWASKSADQTSWTEECNFHAAAAERMKLLGNMAIDLDDATRLKLCRQAQDIFKRLTAHLEDTPEKLDPIKSVREETDVYYQKFGTRTARYYMYEQGVIDEWGDQKISD